MEAVLFTTDYEEASLEIIRRVQNAASEIYYSYFMCDFKCSLPGTTVNLHTLFKQAAERGVQIFITYNVAACYGNSSVEELQALLPFASIRSVNGDGYINGFLTNFVEHKKYSNHHQKYLAIDGKYVFLCAVEMHPQRQGWLKLNSDGFYWHEIGVVFRCTPEIWRYIQICFHNGVMPPPFPLVNGNVVEHKLICKMISEAENCIHMENQICISSGTTLNQVFTAVANRIIKSFRQQDDFRFMFITNLYQMDEAKFIEHITKNQLYWSLNHLRKSVLGVGVPQEFIDSRVFIGHLEHNNIPIKIHSNIIIKDGYECLRSSSNLSDRSLSVFKCDNELGILCKGENVKRLQQTLWNRYFRCAPTVFSPQEAFENCCSEQGVMQRIDNQRFFLCNVLLEYLHETPFYGKQVINWTLS